MHILSAIRGVLFPRNRCLACDEPREMDTGAALCDTCADELQRLSITDGVCTHCLSPQRSGQNCLYCSEGGMVGLSAAYAAFRYHGVVQRLVLRLKFRGIHHAAEPLVEGMAASLRGVGFDAMVPVPLHKKRERERGFNQAALLAQGLQDKGLGAVLHALKRNRNTKRQSSLPHHKRNINVRDSFEVIAPVKGLSILLVDDVRTSGNTARECARALRKSGALDVALLTASVAAQHHSSSKPPFDSSNALQAVSNEKPRLAK